VEEVEEVQELSKVGEAKNADSELV